MHWRQKPARLHHNISLIVQSCLDRFRPLPVWGFIKDFAIERDRGGHGRPPSFGHGWPMRHVLLGLEYGARAFLLGILGSDSDPNPSKTRGFRLPLRPRGRERSGASPDRGRPTARDLRSCELDTRRRAPRALLASAASVSKENKKRTSLSGRVKERTSCSGRVYSTRGWCTCERVVGWCVVFLE